MDNEPAFPVTKNIFAPDPNFPDGPVYHVGTEPHYGMTLRDYFAANALLGTLTGEKDLDGWSKEGRAKWCYEQAEAMLKARLSPEGGKHD